MGFRDTLSVIGGAGDVRKRMVAPFIDPVDGRLVLTDGEGEQKRWGSPFAQNTSHWLTPEIVQIHLSFGGERWRDTALFYFHYDCGAGTWTRLLHRPVGL
jgi:hypothetical protein